MHESSQQHCVSFIEVQDNFSEFFDTKEKFLYPPHILDLLKINEQYRFRTNT